MCSLFGRLEKNDPIASKNNEKLKHEIAENVFVSCFFFGVFYIILFYFNTCVNIFVLLKAKAKEKEVETHNTPNNTS